MRDRMLAAAIMAVCAAVFLGTLSLPAPSFEPLGSAAFPRAISVMIAVLCIPLLLRPPLKRLGPGAADEPDQDGTARDPMMSVWLIVAAFALAALMAMRLVKFAVLATAFLFVTMTILTRFKLRAMPFHLAIAAALGFGIDYLFTNILIIDLP